MKEKILTFFLVIIMLLLIGSIMIFLFAIYFDLSSEDVIQTIQESAGELISVETPENESNKPKQGITGVLAQIFSAEEPEVTYSSQASEGKFFYEQLTDTQKILYNGFQENKENMISGDYVIQYGSKFSDLLAQENGSKILGDDYQAAIEAYVQDNPDIFYIDISKLYLNIETIKKTWSTTYNVYIGPSDGDNYYESHFSNAEQVREANSKIEAVKAKVLSGLTNNAYKNVEMIHNFLVDNIEYDSTFQGKGSYSMYGALIEQRCVCEGYAESFKYLLNAAGIECEIIKGTGTNSSGQVESHAWNAVKLYDKWYYVDCTWDDPIILGNGRIFSNVKYKYFLKGTDSFKDDHIVDTKFSEAGRDFAYPEVSKEDY